MTINIADNAPRISYSVAEGVTQTSFAVPFEFFDNADLSVYVDGTLKTLTTNYTVSGGGGATGTIALSVTGISGGSTVIVTRSIALERTTDFPVSGSFNITALNTELDRVVAIAADIKDDLNRSLRLTDYDTAVSLVLPNVNTRKGKTLAFNLSTGAVESGPSISDTQTVADASADIALLADIQDGTVAANAITNVNTIRTDVSTVSGISGNVTTVAGNNANVTTVAGISGNVTTVAGIDSNVTTVAGISANVTAVAGNATNINTVAADGTDIGIVSTNIANVNTVAGINANVSTVAGISANVTTVATNNANVTSVGTNIANVNTVATNDANVTTVAGIIANVNTVAGISANVTTVATNNANVTAVGTNIADVSTVAAQISNNNLQTIAADIAAVITVANDLTEASSEIDVVANSIANVDIVGADITNVNTVATNINSVNDYADKYRIGATDPTVNNDQGDMFYNTTTEVLKIYTGSAWEQGVTAGSGFLALTGGSIVGNVDVSLFLEAGYYQSDDTVTYSHTFEVGKNAMSIGPITIPNGVVLTIPAGATYTVI